MYGVAAYLDNKAEKTFSGYNPVNERIISVRLNGSQRNITIILIYAQTGEEEI